MIVSAPESVAPRLRTAGRILEAVRERAPLVQAVTNTVVTGFTANVLLALGAAPAMVDIPGEAAPFAAAADGVLINLGTPHREPREAMLEAARAASAVGTPWVLDPVAIGTLPVRTRLAAELLDLDPIVIRGNASEIIALAGHGAGGRGVDATDTAVSALEAARALAAAHGAVVAVSGEVDVITDGARVVRAANGHPLLTRVTGGGCALGAVLAAFAGSVVDGGADAGAEVTGGADAGGVGAGAEDAGGVGAGPEPSRTGEPVRRPVLVDAVVAAVTAYNVAAEHAAAVASGPGSFAVAFLDALAAVTPADLEREGRLA